jgi:hypothetical protein
MARLTPALQQRFKTAEQQSGIPAAILAGIASRESGMGSPAVLARSGMSRSRGNHGYGIMQVDQAAHVSTVHFSAETSRVTNAVRALCIPSVFMSHSVPCCSLSRSPTP